MMRTGPRSYATGRTLLLKKARRRADGRRPDMREALDLDRYPLDQPTSRAYEALVLKCRAELTGEGMFNLDGFVRTDTIRAAAAKLAPMFGSSAWTHAREHNVY